MLPKSHEYGDWGSMCFKSYFSTLEIMLEAITLMVLSRFYFFLFLSLLLSWIGL